MATNSASANNPANAQNVQLTPHEFLKSTKPLRNKLLPQQAFSENGSVTFQLNQSGLLNQLYVKFECDITITATTLTAGTWAALPQPAPYGLVQKMQLYNNNSYLLRDLDGWSWYRWVRQRYGWDVASANPAMNFTQNVAKVLGNKAYTGGIVPGAALTTGAGTTTYHLSIALPVPVAYNRSGDTGLIVLPTPGVYYYLKLQFGSIIAGLTATGGSTSLITGLVGTGLSYAISNVSLKCEQEYFMIPLGSQGKLKNFVSMFMACTSQNIPIINQGQNIYIPPPNDFYTYVQLELINNGVHQPGTSISNIQWKYAGQTVDYQDDLDMMYVFNSWNSGQLPMDGVIEWDLGYRLGNLHKRDTYDAFNAQQVTGLQFEWTNSDAITGVSQATAVLESLRPIGQPY